MAELHYEEQIGEHKDAVYFHVEVKFDHAIGTQQYDKLIDAIESIADVVYDNGGTNAGDE